MALPPHQTGTVASGDVANGAPDRLIAAARAFLAVNG